MRRFRTRPYTALGLFYLIEPAGGNGYHRKVGMIDHESRRCAGYLFDAFLLDIVDFHLFAVAPLGIVGGQRARLLKGPIRDFGFAVVFQDYMGTGDSLGVKPPVVSAGEPEGQILVLVIIFAYIDVITVRGNVMEGLTCNLGPFVAWSAFLYISILHQFFFDLHQIVFSQGNIQGGADRFQVIDLGSCLVGQLA